MTSRHITIKHVSWQDSIGHDLVQEKEEEPVILFPCLSHVPQSRTWKWLKRQGRWIRHQIQRPFRTSSTNNEGQPLMKVVRWKDLEEKDYYDNI